MISWRQLGLRGGGRGPLGSARATADALLGRGAFKPRVDVREIELCRPLDWGDDPLEDDNWCLQLHAMRFLFAPMVVHESTGDARYLDAVLAWLDDWGKWHRDREATYSWVDMTTGRRAAVIAWALDRSRDDWLRRLLDAHVAQLSRPEFQKIYNHGIHQAHGLMCAAQVTGDASARAIASDFMNRLLNQQFLDDGIHAEHSCFYHSYALRLFESALRTGWYGARSAEKLQQARVNEKWMVDPTARHHTIGDSDPSDCKVDPATHDLDPGDPVSIAGRRFRTRHFAASGYLFARSDWDTPVDATTSLVMHAGHHSLVHKHLDALTFNWYESGRPLLVESGKFGYQAGPTRNFFIQTRAHNTVEIGAQSDALLPPTGAGVGAIHTDGDSIVLAAQVERLQRTVDNGRAPTLHDRRIALRPGRSLVVRDRLSRARPRRMIQWFHFAPDLDLTVHDDRVVACRDGVEVLRITGQAGAEVITARGEREPMQGWVSPGYLELVPRWSLGFAVRGKKVVIETRFECA